MRAVRELSNTVASDFPAEWYDITAEGHFWLEWRFRAFRALLAALGVDGQRGWYGLDVGCGHGVVRRQIEENIGWVTDGADLNRAALERNRTRGGEALYYDINDRQSDLAERYDFVLLFDVIEHIRETARFVDSALYHLKPGGWLFLNVPALDSMRSGYDEVVGHLRRYDRKSLCQELESHPLQLRDLRYWGLSMLPYLLFRKLTSPRGQPVSEIIEHGVLPPRPWMNDWIFRIMKIETALLKKPFVGTSLMAAAVKTRHKGSA